MTSAASHFHLLDGNDSLALLLKLSYEDLAIGEGQGASDQYLNWFKCTMEQEPLFSNLREYCERDTVAMVELLKILKKHGD